MFGSTFGGPEAGGGYGPPVASGGFGAGSAGGVGGSAGGGVSTPGGSLGGFLAPSQEGRVAAVQGGGRASGGDSAGVGGQRQVNTLTPVTIKMLCDAVKQNGSQAQGPDQPYIVNNRELGMLTLVACVDSVSEQSMYKEYMLNDGTGRLKAHWYVDGDRVPPQQVVRPGVYVRVYGTLQSWQGQEGLNVVQVTKVVQANEIAYHFIEVAHIHLSLTGQLVKGASADVAPLAAPGGCAACGGGGLQAFGAGGCHQAPPQSGVVVSGSYEQQQLQGAPQLGAGGGVTGGDLPQPQHQQQPTVAPQQQFGRGAPGGLQPKQELAPPPQFGSCVGAGNGGAYGPRPGGPCGGGSASGAGYPPPLRQQQLPSQQHIGGGAPGGFQQQQPPEPSLSPQFAAGAGVHDVAPYVTCRGHPCGGGSAFVPRPPQSSTMGAQYGAGLRGSGGPYGGSSGPGDMMGGQGAGSGERCAYGPTGAGQAGCQGGPARGGCGVGQSAYGAPPVNQGGRMEAFGGGAGFGGTGGAAGGVGGGGSGFY